MNGGVKWYLDYPNVKVFLSITVKITALHLKKIRYSPYQQELWEIIKEKNHSGMCYRKIAKQLNAEGVTTHQGKLKGKNICSVIKRHKERKAIGVYQ